MSVKEFSKIIANGVQVLNEDEILVIVPPVQRGTERSFVIPHIFHNYIVEYMALRPQNSSNENFFYKYENGNSIDETISCKEIKLIPKNVASFLGLKNADNYCINSCRNNSGDLMIGLTSTIDEIKRLSRGSIFFFLNE